ncbi:MAG: hypothetical protein COW03_00380 [Cytophagales bacterium CG12_big_fil_rev_8_21_14_0_65_40_12]|nr:MAG: hypothetical protein COW03_00380 [Cytophagales bacterium CG12_big_fil_rev_8_21_14_0_65_40_12]PIW04560.1 MAG: hypothetical protein COW40_09160 [Cytophagales bacterium CG17_big_fil_post_rev_8_21_14_2_50_40_13]
MHLVYTLLTTPKHDIFGIESVKNIIILDFYFWEAATCHLALSLCCPIIRNSSLQSYGSVNLFLIGLMIIAHLNYK